MRHRSPGRFLAPLALLAAVLAVALVVSAATGGDEEGAAKRSGSTSTDRGSTSTAERTASGDGESRTSTAPSSRRKTYTVEPGDTLGSIAESAGVSIEELQELNPDVDPQSLTVGQRLRLRR